jgi:hypothetical protein
MLTIGQLGNQSAVAIGVTMSKVVSDELELEGLRERLCEMADGELLRFGWVTKNACSGGGKPGERGRESCMLQLHEAREEWNRRKTRLPLRGSF